MRYATDNSVLEECEETRDRPAAERAGGDAPMRISIAGDDPRAFFHTRRPDAPMRILIASDDVPQARRIAEILTQQAPESPAAVVVSLELATDRASRHTPTLLVLVLPEPPDAGLLSLREMCGTVRGAHVLVVGPATDAKLILNALREGADEFLDQALLEDELSDALLRLKMRRAAPDKPSQSGKIIACLAPSGGCGSSTVAANISAVLAGKAGRCALVDLRLAAGDLAAMLGVTPRYTIADLADRLDRVDQSMFAQFFARHSSGVHLLAAPRDYAEISRVTTQAVRRTLVLARTTFPYVVADLDNAFSSEQVEALWQSDVILLVLRLDFTSIRNVRRTLDNLADMKIPLEQVRVIVNGYGEARQLGYRQAEEALGLKISHYIPSDPGRVNAAVNHGVPVVLQKPSAKVSRSLKDLAASVNGAYSGP